MTKSEVEIIERRLKASLSGRLRSLWQRSLTDSERRREEKSFSITYLRDPNAQKSDHSLDVELTKYALFIALDEGIQSSKKFIEEIEVDANKGKIRKIISSIYEDYSDVYPSTSIYDQFLLPRYKPSEYGAVRDCYNHAFAEIGIRLPLRNKDLLDIFQCPAVNSEISKPTNFSETRDLISEFLHNFWPIFDSSTLRIPLLYFDLGKILTSEELGQDFSRAKGFGLDCILARQVALRAVWGHREDRAALRESEVHDAASLSPRTEKAIAGFFDSSASSGLTKEDLQKSKLDPIERAINLSIYVYEREDSFDLLERLIFVYEIDREILQILNWSRIWNDVEDSCFYRAPELVFLASSLTLSGALENFEHERADYLPSGASTDLESYARHCASEHGMTTHRFFASLSKLTPHARTVVFRYLLRPGVIDNIVNVFPTIKVPVREPRHKEAVNTLTTKLDCIRYIRTKRILPDAETRPIERECRRLLRHTYFEASASEGRIRVSRKQLAIAIQYHVAEEVESQLQLVDELNITGSSLRHAIIDRRLELCADSTASWICFECRYAFDYLLSNLRHNFIRFKIESAIDEVFKPTDFECDALKIAIAGTIDEFNYLWLTINPRRSFYAKLKDNILDVLRSDYNSGGLQTDISGRIAGLSIDAFRVLLEKCRENWETKYREACFQELKEQAESQSSDVDTVLVDQLGHALDKVFSESSEWMKINEDATALDFGLKELCDFEAAVFSSAKTKRPEFSVVCYKGRRRNANVIHTDFIIKGEHFDRCSILIQNLLENAYGNSYLPVAETEIEISIIQQEQSLRLEFRNRFKMEERLRIESDVAAFNSAVRLASAELYDAPIETGGSGIKRIIYEFSPVNEGKFSISALSDEIIRGIFLVVCDLPAEVISDERPDN